MDLLDMDLSFLDFRMDFEIESIEYIRIRI